MLTLRLVASLSRRSNPRRFVAALGSADARVLVETDNLPARASCNDLKLAALVFCGLSVCRNSQIDADALHDAPLAEAILDRPLFRDLI